MGELRLRVVSTLAGWVISLIVIGAGARWANSLTPPTAAVPVPASGASFVQGPAPASEAPAVALGDTAPTAARPLAAASPASVARRLIVAEPLGANLRAEPSTASTIVATLPSGAVVDDGSGDAEAPASSREWRSVRWNGQPGWVLADLLQPAAPSPQ